MSSSGPPLLTVTRDETDIVEENLLGLLTCFSFTKKIQDAVIHKDYQGWYTGDNQESSWQCYLKVRLKEPEATQKTKQVETHTDSM